MSLTEVSSILWRERELLELLLFKLEEEQLLLAAGRSRWLGHATREVEMVLEEIRRAELGRAVEVEAVAAQLGLPAGISLRELAEQAPPRGTTSCASTATPSSPPADEITALAQDQPRAAHRRLPRRPRHAACRSATPEPTTYTPNGQSVRARAAPDC